MKIRIQGNSLRFRLKKSEIEKLALEKYISEEVVFDANTKFSYSIIAKDIEEISVFFKDNTISVIIPLSQEKLWTQTDLISIRNNISTPIILLEKDFKCTSKQCLETEIEIKDSFTNPNI